MADWLALTWIASFCNLLFLFICTSFSRNNVCKKTVFQGYLLEIFCWMKSKRNLLFCWTMKSPKLFLFISQKWAQINKNNYAAMLFQISTTLITFCKWIQNWRRGSVIQLWLLYLSTQICFSIRGECVTCCWSKLTNSLGKQQLELSTRTWSGRAPWNHSKFVSQPASGK